MRWHCESKKNETKNEKEESPAVVVEPNRKLGKRMAKIVNCASNLKYFSSMCIFKAEHSGNVFVFFDYPQTLHLHPEDQHTNN